MSPSARRCLPLGLTCLLAVAWPATWPHVGAQRPPAPIVPPTITVPDGSAGVEQTAQGERPAAVIAESFGGLGAGFEGPQGTAAVRNPSDNSLAVGPDHIVQTVNSRMAIFTKKGRRFESTGRALYGPVNTNNVFRGFGGTCEAVNNGDAVVRYDQLADRWLIVMPIFRRAEARPDQPADWMEEGRVYLSPPGRPEQPGPAALLVAPPAPAEAAAGVDAQRGRGGQTGQTGAAERPSSLGPYAMCYAVSTGTDPFGPYYRYEFLRPLFPDYPRPAVWPDGYYVPTSTGDDPISETIATQKHACVADRARMLRGEPASEQCIVLNNVGFLNNADVDGKTLPPAGAPNVMMAAGGMQLRKQFEAAHVDAWQFRVDWQDPARTAITGPVRIPVAPYRYLCDGQLTDCVPQPGTDRRLDAQGDKIMSRLVYRRIGRRESIVGVHSVNTAAGGGGVRWYEFRIDPERRVSLHQQGTYAPDGLFRWMASPAIDARGNIGIGYSFGGTPHFAGQRFAARLAEDPPGRLTLGEAVLVEGEASQAATRWEDYTQTAMDPADDCTIYYVGDYLKSGATAYSTRIGAFRLPGCPAQEAALAPSPPRPPAPPAEPTPADILRGAYGPYRSNNDLLSYDLDVRVDPVKQSISGTNTIRFRMLKDASRIQLDLTAALNVDGITLGGRDLQYEREFGAVLVNFPERLKKGRVYEVAFRYSGTPSQSGRFGGIAFRTDPAGRPWINTACQHIGASVWWPNKDQYRDEVEEMHLRVAVPSDLVDVSNGKFLGKTDLGDGYTRWDWHIQYPINNYSVSLNIGHYTHFTGEVDGQTLDFYCLPENLDRARAQFAQATTMMQAFQKYFGPYPFPKDGYKLIEAPYSGMEHQSAVTYGNRFANGYLERDWTGVGISTRFDFIIVHESAHEWFGNAVTASDVCDEWIHEAWGTWAEGVYVEYAFGKADALNYLNGYRSKVRNRDPIVPPCGINRVPPQDMYFKGALFINTLRSVVDDDARWWRMVGAFVDRFKHRTVATADIVRFFNKAAGRDLTPIFNQYLRHAAIPVLELRFAESGGSVAYRWKVDARGFSMPVKVGAKDDWQTIRPTAEWQRLATSLSKDQFEVATDLYFIDVDRQ